MTKVEIGKLLAVIAAAYDRFEVNEFKQQLWYEMLGDIQYEIAQVALKKLILESPYPPSIADIRKQIVEVTTPKANQIDSGQAWGEVMKALKNYGFYNPEGALASMSPTTQEVVKRISWREICMQEEETMGVLRGQFIRIYDSMAQKQRQEDLLPLSVQEQIRLISENFSHIKGIEAGEDKKLLKGAI